MSLKCLFRYDDGSYCKRWAQKDSRFCYNHQPQGLDGPGGTDWPSLHPFTRLATLSDLFDLLRESLNAARMGTMPAAQAASICSLATLWLKTYEKMESADRIYALSHQILPTLVDAESAAHAERLAAATAETERAASFAAELDHIADYGPPPSEAALAETDAASAPTTSEGHGLSQAETGGASAPTASGGHGFSRATLGGAQAPTSLPEAHAESAALGQTQRDSAPPQPVNLREAQAKLEAMLAEQRAATSPANPNGR
jgi:hypothetical protein